MYAAHMVRHARVVVGVTPTMTLELALLARGEATLRHWCQLAPMMFFREKNSIKYSLNIVYDIDDTD